MELCHLWGLLTNSAIKPDPFDGSEEKPESDKLDEDADDEDENIVGGIVRYAGGISRYC